MNTSAQTSDPNRTPAERMRAFVDEIEMVYMLDRPRKFGTERRAVERVRVTMPVKVTPLDDDLQPLSHLYHGITRDLSSQGVGLVTSSPVGRNHVVLTFQPCRNEPFTVIGKIIFCNNLGYYYHVGCEFLTT